MLAILLIVVGQSATPIDLHKMEIGDVGVFDTRIYGIGGGQSANHTYSALQILGPGQVIIKSKTYLTARAGTPAALAGSDLALLEIDTSKLVDGKAINPPELWRASGKFTYTTAAGAKKTILRISSISADELKRISAVKDFEANKRTWRDSSGQFSIEAAYGRFEPGNVWLIKQDGSTVKVPLSRLSNSDRRLAVSIAKERGELP